ncbi:MAG: ATP-dependent exonuclease SbcCD, C subunit-like protein, partial [bacterium]|nr:ATP-dependent exonuclease SbcCD, C subunit-like protein [bacterium]
MTQTSQDLLDFAPSDERAGYRLQRFEVYNWGTFHDRVWSIEPGGHNALLTGDIGSGKSTLVDAVTTLLVPPQRITYNKAAGAEARERSLRTYVLGYYKSERGESGLSARSVALRDHNSYSVILGHFYNEGYDRHVTLAQVFWMSKTQGQPERFYAIADRELSIATDFAGFGTDINSLRKRLRAQPQVQLHESFPPYGAALRRSFGIDSEQALDLFNQTVSLKSVGNLTDFVRGHMLEAFPVAPRIEGLITHFDDLDRAHRAVLEARAQISALKPLVEAADHHQSSSAEVSELRDCRLALHPYFAQLRSELLTQRLDRLDTDLRQLATRLQRLTDQRRAHQTRRDEIKQAISNNGGDRLEQLKVEIGRLQEQHKDRSRRAREYGELATSLDFADALDESTFHDNRQRVERALLDADDAEAQLQNQVTEAAVALQQQQSRHDDVATELASLRQRRSNLPAHVLSLRDRLCADLSLPAESLPFVGELLQVRPEESDWEGAIERVLHNFALSLLVPDEQYRDVADWVDRTHLRGRLVYYRIRPPRLAALAEPQPTSLLRKLSIRPEASAYAWLEHRLADHFDYACCV